MTKHEYYDLLVQSCYDGTFPSINEEGRCLYKNGQKKCAVGILLSDELYSPSFEGKPCYTLVMEGYLEQNIIPEGFTLEELKDIQIIHDSCARLFDQEKFVSSFLKKISPYFEDI